MSHREFLRDIQAEGSIHQALITRHKRNTGALEVEKIRKTVFQKDERQSSASMQKAEVIRAIREEEERKKEREVLQVVDISDEYTVLIPAFSLPALDKPVLKLREEEIEQLVEEAPNLHSQEIEVVPAKLPVDEQGRPYLGMTVPYRSEPEDTVWMAEQLVIKYLSLRGEYPDVIFLTAFRYFTVTMRSEHFIIGNTRIPYAYDAHAVLPFDVMVRGNKAFLL